ncbi:hypothetical protein ACWF82_05270 [Nocardia sp. NPDC055053]
MTSSNDREILRRRAEQLLAKNRTALGDVAHRPSRRCPGQTVPDPFTEPAPPSTEAERERYELTMRQQFVAVTRARDSVWLSIVRG